MNLFNRFRRSIRSTKPRGQSDTERYSPAELSAATDSAISLAEVVNDSIEIAQSTNNLETKESRIRVARKRLEELKNLSKEYPAISIEELKHTEDELTTLEHESQIHLNDPSYKVEGLTFWHPDLIEKVKKLKREEENEEAEKLLLEIIKATENHSAKTGQGVAPWAYEQIAIIYRKQKRLDDEAEVLRRFAAQEHASGAKPPKLLERLEKVVAKQVDRASR